MGLRVEFGLFGRSENSSFPSTLRAWFASAHTSPSRKSNRSDAKRGLQGILNPAPLFRMTDKIKPLRDTSHPSLPQSGEGAFCGFLSTWERGFARWFPLNLGKGVCKIPSPTRGGLGWGAITTLSFRATTRNRIVERFVMDGIIFNSPSAGDTGSSPV